MTGTNGLSSLAVTQCPARRLVSAERDFFVQVTIFIFGYLFAFSNFLPCTVKTCQSLYYELLMQPHLWILLHP
jgi:hypothetical protein